MNDTPELMELYQEFYRLEEKMAFLTTRLTDMEDRFRTETDRFHKELETQKSYYSNHIKELYKRNQLAVK
jgi:hypothetical protein